jgi:hypothetical protein
MYLRICMNKMPNQRKCKQKGIRKCKQKGIKKILRISRMEFYNRNFLLLIISFFLGYM